MGARICHLILKSRTIRSQSTLVTDYLVRIAESIMLRTLWPARSVDVVNAFRRTETMFAGLLKSRLPKETDGLASNAHDNCCANLPLCC